MCVRTANDGVEVVLDSVSLEKAIAETIEGYTPQITQAQGTSTSSKGLNGGGYKGLEVGGVRYLLGGEPPPFAIMWSACRLVWQQHFEVWKYLTNCVHFISYLN
jgi:hypothetical protein